MLQHRFGAERLGESCCKVCRWCAAHACTDRMCARFISNCRVLQCPAAVPPCSSKSCKAPPLTCARNAPITGMMSSQSSKNVSVTMLPCASLTNGAFSNAATNTDLSSGAAAATAGAACSSGIAEAAASVIRLIYARATDQGACWLLW